MRINLQSIRRVFRNITLVTLTFLTAQSDGLHAQVYLTENFDSSWTGIPAAPPGWT